MRDLRLPDETMFHRDVSGVLPSQGVEGWSEASTARPVFSGTIPEISMSISAIRQNETTNRRKSGAIQCSRFCTVSSSFVEGDPSRAPHYFLPRITLDECLLRRKHAPRCSPSVIGRWPYRALHTSKGPCACSTTLKPTLVVPHEFDRSRHHVVIASVTLAPTPEPSTRRCSCILR